MEYITQIAVFAFSISTIIISFFSLERNKLRPKYLLLIAATSIGCLIFSANELSLNKKDYRSTTIETATIRSSLLEDQQILNNSLKRVRTNLLSANDIRPPKVDSIVIVVAQFAYDSTLAVFNHIDRLDEAIARNREVAPPDTIELVLNNIITLRKQLITAYDSITS